MVHVPSTGLIVCCRAQADQAATKRLTGKQYFVQNDTRITTEGAEVCQNPGTRVWNIVIIDLPKTLGPKGSAELPPHSLWGDYFGIAQVRSMKTPLLVN